MPQRFYDQIQMITCFDEIIVGVIRQKYCLPINENKVDGGKCVIHNMRMTLDIHAFYC